MCAGVTYRFTRLMSNDGSRSFSPRRSSDQPSSRSIAPRRRSGFTEGANCSATRPLRSTRNLVKFHLIASVPEKARSRAFQRLEKRMRVPAVHLHLLEHRKAYVKTRGADPAVSAASPGVPARRTGSAWKTKNGGSPANCRKRCSSSRMRLPHGERGKAVQVPRVPSRAQRRSPARRQPARAGVRRPEAQDLVGDKMAGRHGNKGVIAKI